MTWKVLEHRVLRARNSYVHIRTYIYTVGSINQISCSNYQRY